MSIPLGSNKFQQNYKLTSQNPRHEQVILLEAQGRHESWEKQRIEAWSASQSGHDSFNAVQFKDNNKTCADIEHFIQYERKLSHEMDAQKVCLLTGLRHVLMQVCVNFPLTCE
jgi:hypothetical protein